MHDDDFGFKKCVHLRQEPTPAAIKWVKHLIVAINFKEAINLARGTKIMDLRRRSHFYLCTVDFLENFLVSAIDS